ncbi:MAG: pyruvate kinase [Parcubacteria group bacterium]|jgi:pyruvate kinase
MTKKTKIIATIGPASDSREKLVQLVEAGVNVVRLNFSHGDYVSHGNIIKLIRELGVEMKRPIGIVADLQGPRIRIAIDNDLEIEKGEIIRVSDAVAFPNFQFPISNFQTNSNDPISKIIFLDYPDIIGDINIGNEILIEDGIKRLKVTKKQDEFLEAEVLNGGIIKNHKGVNIPDANFHFGAMTEKDERDLEFAVGQEVDFVALSFVSNGKEIEAVREKIKKILGRDLILPQIISKIERKEAMKNIKEIIKASDVVMVARGDLGIEMEESKVVIYQKELIAKCLKANKPVIVATQMLDSMIVNPIPTRAEVSDVSNAVIDHTDAVMLSGESASGKYPVEAVKVMRDIIKNVEESPFDDINPGFLDDDIFTDFASLINSAHELARSSKAKAIIMYTETGLTARLMSHHRPEQLMIAATNNLKTYNQLSIVWGIRAYLFENGESRENFIDLIIEKTKNDHKLEKGDKAVVILGRTSTGRSMTLIGIKEVG